ncbi:hypothetical protein BDQ94DRAFT_164533 [Aspergillus welwitschiae]|uniref:Uncharacterized protein n=2 Tax=Aspergillus subgen. Circumdati TaxID=2720871 RepID=A0A3F3PHE9_9EURO|nr:uncharacterized protein BO96DRAFT_469403 [Aspergillus niger CBS 101883]XP_026619406.1 hypothetical protein BDQ94DRAFT_164533 [Aspergillus welwitschiae]PYH52147.1 hypothetical protein BO96DRAFT_469403 [Aspergillus niger CBS 101883]RDH26384.1 hypothetical protein BDQ94DRAFT_164533 [Aspergillus welwitschiae]
MTSLHDSSRPFAHVSPLLSKFETIMAPHTLLPEAILVFPAQSTVKAVHIYFLGLIYGSNFVNISRLDQNETVCRHVEEISSDLTPDALLKLSLLTWHFDARGDFSQELLQFITELDEFEEVCQVIWERYSDHSEHYVSCKVFTVEMLRLIRFLEGYVARSWTETCGRSG